VLSKTLAGCRTTKMRMALSAFTMAEILLSLTIIGVVAAITLPSLTGNINERTWNTQRKALFARFSQAIALMPALNGYGTLDGTTDTVAETFITSGLSKVLKINNICDSTHLADCGIPTNINALNGTSLTTPQTMSQLNAFIIQAETYSQRDTNAAAFETANGESILLFYNPSCVSAMGENDEYYTQAKVCANMIFDLNGSKGPNTVGKDIGFMTVLYPTDSSVVAPNVPVQKASDSITQQEALGACKQQDSEFRIPSRDELVSLFVNQKLINGALTEESADYWSATLASSTMAWAQGFRTGKQVLRNRTTHSGKVHCVKR
ncbi:MAG: hypothetical protein NC390_00845, partial [Fusobacterium sp.]|nr:hypothetical protein [Fusobacterium sp.]